MPDPSHDRGAGLGVDGPADPEHDPSASYALEPAYVRSLTGRILARTDDTVTTYCPFSGQPLAVIPQSSADDVAEAFRRARRAQEAWAATPVHVRAQKLLNLHDIILDRQDALHRLVRELERISEPEVGVVGLSEADEASVLTFDDEAEPIRITRGELRAPLSLANVNGGTPEAKRSIRGVPRGNVELRQSRNIIRRRLANEESARIFAALAGVPVVALPYASKVGGFLRELEIPAQAEQDTGETAVYTRLDPEELKRRVSEALCRE